VEVLKDVSFYLAPLTVEEAKQMLINTKMYQILKGVRGQEGVDIKAIAEGLTVRRKFNIIDTCTLEDKGMSSQKEKEEWTDKHAHCIQ